LWVSRWVERVVVGGRGARGDERIVELPAFDFKSCHLLLSLFLHTLAVTLIDTVILVLVLVLVIASHFAVRLVFGHFCSRVVLAVISSLVVGIRCLVTF
jgi:hypothetical protein